MSNLVGATVWAKYKAAMMDAHDTFANKEIIWVRAKRKESRYGEDKPKEPTQITLLGLYNSNFMRTWPVTIPTSSGEIDEQSAQLFFNKEYLLGLGYLNADGYFDYNPGLDRFLIDGIEYKPFGDTATAQMHDDDAWVTVIIKRSPAESGNPR